MTGRRVLVLFCGGTLVMEEDERGSLLTPALDRAIRNLTEMETRLDEVAAVDVAHIDNIDSSNIRPEHWDRVAAVVAERYDEYDGFVITHGTDTLAYTASALSFVLGNLGKPVVLTGSQIPGRRIESDARRNFVNAVRVATMDVAGVLVVFDRKIILGARATKVFESRLDAFESVNGALVGEIRLDILLAAERRRRHGGALEPAPGFDENVVIITLAPGMPRHILMDLVGGSIGGLVLRGFGTGNVAYEHQEAVELAVERSIPVVVTTQCLHGATVMQRYDLGRRLLDLGAIQGHDMGTECIVTKLMWALRRASSVEEVRAIMHTSYTGEIVVPGSSRLQ
jgi:L-asparaginase